MLTLTVDRPCVNDKGQEITVGTVVKYIAHVPGGMVRVEWNGEACIIHPAATKELR